MQSGSDLEIGTSSSRNINAAAIQLSLLFVAAVACNFFFLPITQMMDRRGGSPPIFLFFLVGGFLAQPIILGIWLIMGSGKGWIRIATFLALGFVLILAWGTSAYNWDNFAFGSTRRFWESYGLVVFLPLVTIVGALPLLIFRGYGNSYFADSSSGRLSPRSVSIANLMGITALVAIVMSLTQFGVSKLTDRDIEEYSVRSSHDDVYFGLAVSSIFAFAVGLIIILPSVYWMMRGRRRVYWRAACGLPVIAFTVWSIGFWGFMLSFVENRPPSRIEREMWLYLAVAIMSSQLYLAMFLGALRMAGLRLVSGSRSSTANIETEPIENE